MLFHTAGVEVVELELHAIGDAESDRRERAVGLRRPHRNRTRHRRRPPREFRHQRVDRDPVGVLGKRRQVLEARDQSGRLPAGEPGRIVDRHEIGEHDLVVVLEAIPGDIEQVVVLVRRGLAGDPRHRDQLDCITNAGFRHSEVRRGLGDRHAIVVHQPRHQRE